ncbi:MAG TPA: SDR family NAD(P)-dependent oxidoreductase, partial [Burkholderiales bacterium]|nr:SDR family NAD(P)-dependent oxidoreductase [Burkholderiales bacterium]
MWNARMPPSSSSWETWTAAGSAMALLSSLQARKSSVICYSRRRHFAERAMDLGLKQKNVLITGGSKGIGLACARAFLAEGARVAIVSRSQANLEAARDSLGKVHV